MCGQSASVPGALDDFRVIRDNLAGGNRSTRHRVIPSCLFIDPPVAQIGLTENEAKRQGIEVQVAKSPMMAVLRSRTIDETNGFMKALIDPNDGKILGFTMIGPEAGEVMAVVQMAMLAGFPGAEVTLASMYQARQSKRGEVFSAVSQYGNTVLPPSTSTRSNYDLCTIVSAWSLRTIRRRHPCGPTPSPSTALAGACADDRRLTGVMPLTIYAFISMSFSCVPKSSNFLGPYKHEGAQMCQVVQRVIVLT